MKNQAQLEKFAVRFLKENYGLDLSIPILINGRIKTTLGRFVHRVNPRVSLRIDMSKDFLNNNDKDMIEQVLKHELVHYALYEKKMGHKDGQADFENELERLGVVSQSTIDRFQISSKVQAYDCVECSHRFIRTRRLRNNGVNHRCNCGGRLKDMGKVVVTGKG